MDLSRPYPLILSARQKRAIWGGSDWSGLADPAPESSPPLGELWLNDDRPGGSRVLNGPLEGVGLDRLVREEPGAVLGPDLAGAGRFPILIKFLNSEAWLSVQVHPDSEKYGPQGSKAEAWHILKAPKEPSLILGLKPGTGPERLRKAVRGGGLEVLLNRASTRPGQTLFIPGGLVHSIGPGLLLFEIQQNNDITYRFHDWNRLDEKGRPRPLHIEQSLEAARPGLAPSRPIQTPTLAEPGGQRTFLTACSHFLLCLLELDREAEGCKDRERFVLLTGLEGRGRVRGGGVEAELEPGVTVLVPACLEDYRIIPEGRLKILESIYPDPDRDLIGPLKKAGVEDRLILGLAGPEGGRELGPALERWERQGG
jgi:mannose-6-phosphate isomerase